MHAYVEKAMREAGEHTDWMSPDEEFEASVHGSLDAAYDDPAVTGVVEEIVARIEPAGRSNALAAKLLAITLPGVPDVYQGTELGDFSLVDPDNRRPVDFDAAAHSLVSGEHVKQALTAEALRLRRDRPELFTSYDAVPAEGPAADHVLAFDRGGAITVVTRLPIGLEAKGGWGDTVLRLPDGAARVGSLLSDRPATLVVYR
jgi:(1->4)-alpha-D-glucan 1-alpha-D-glucosylmutase